MHSYRRLVTQEMDAHSWGQSDLAREAGLTRQVVHQIVSDERKRLTQPPHAATVEGLAKAFHLPATAVWGAVAEAMGLPSIAVPSITHEVKGVSDVDLLKELAARMGVEVTVRVAGTATTATTVKGKKTEIIPLAFDDQGD